MKFIESDLTGTQKEQARRLPGFAKLARESFLTYRSKIQTLVNLQMFNLLLSVLVAIVTAIAYRYGFFQTIFFDNDPSLYFRIAATAGISIFIGIFLFFLSLIDSATTIVLRDNNTYLSVKEPLKKALHYVLPSALVGVFFFMSIFLGMAFYFLPGVIFAVWFFPAKYLVLVEDMDWRQAVLESRKFTAGFFWGLLLLLILGVVTVLFVLSALANLTVLPFGDLLNMAATTILWPIFPAYFYLIFCHLRDARRPEAINRSAGGYRAAALAAVAGFAAIIAGAWAIVNNGPAILSDFRETSLKMETRNQELLRQLEQGSGNFKLQ